MFSHSRQHLGIIRRVGLVLVIVVLVTTGLVAGQVARAQGGGIDVVNTVTLNLRSAPTTASVIMAKIPQGTLMRAVARNANVSWVLVQVGNSSGWVSTVFLLHAGNLGDLPIGVNTGVPNNLGSSGGVNAPTTSGGITATAVVTMNIRGGPSLRYPIIGKLLTGQTVQLTGHVGPWLRFRFRDGRAAWVHLSLVILAGGTVDDLPEVSAAGT